MYSLQTLKEFAQKTNNSAALACINKYYEMSIENWCKDHFYLGGQLKLHITEEITQDHIDYVENKYKEALDPINSWEQYSFMSSLGEFNIIKDLYKSTHSH